MTSFNRVLLLGRLSRDPELRRTPLGATACEFSIEVDTLRLQDGDPIPGSDTIPVRTWGKSAEACAARLRKGSLVHLEGHLHTDRWKDPRSRLPRARLLVVAPRVQFLDPPRGADATLLQGDGAPESPFG